MTTEYEEQHWEENKSPEYCPMSPTNWTEPIDEKPSPPPFLLELSEKGSSLYDIWDTHGHMYSTMADMVMAATKEKDIGIVLFPNKRSLSDDVWRVKEYLRSFGHNHAKVALIRARFPLLTDVQWTTIRQQPQFSLDMRSQTLGLVTKRRNNHNSSSLPRKSRRRGHDHDDGIVRRMLEERSSPASISDIFKETELSRSNIEKCVNRLLTEHTITEFVDGTNRTYGVVR